MGVAVDEGGGEFSARTGACEKASVKPANTMKAKNLRISGSLLVVGMEYTGGMAEPRRCTGMDWVCRAYGADSSSGGGGALW